MWTGPIFKVHILCSMNVFIEKLLRSLVRITNLHIQSDDLKTNRSLLKNAINEASRPSYSTSP